MRGAETAVAGFVDNRTTNLFGLTDITFVETGVFSAGQWPRETDRRTGFATTKAA